MPEQQQHGTKGAAHDTATDGGDVYGSVALARVVAIPYVSRAVETAANYVPSSKDSQLVDRFSRLCASHAEPLFERHADTLKQLDQYACKQLDTVESVASSLRHRFTSVHEKVNTNATKVEHALLAPSHVILDRADAFLEAMLPEEEEEEGQQKDQQRTTAATTSATTAKEFAEREEAELQLHRLGQETRQIAARTRSFSQRVQHRAYARARRDLERMRHRGASMLYSVQPDTQPWVEYSEKKLEEWKPALERITSRLPASKVNLSNPAHRPIQRTYALVKQLTADNLQRVRALLHELDELASSIRARAVQSAKTYPAAVSSKAGDLLCSAQQTKMYSRFASHLDDLAHNPRVIYLSETIVRYLETLGIPVPARIKALLPRHQCEEAVQVNLSYADVASGGHNKKASNNDNNNNNEDTNAGPTANEDVDENEDEESCSDEEEEGDTGH